MKTPLRIRLLQYAALGSTLAVFLFPVLWMLIGVLVMRKMINFDI